MYMPLFQIWHSTLTIKLLVLAQLLIIFWLQEYTVFGYFRQSWVDKRLAGKLNQTLVLRNTAIDHAWIPDTYCANTRQSNLKTSASDSESAMRVDINGSVFFTQRFVNFCHKQDKIKTNKGR